MLKPGEVGSAVVGVGVSTMWTSPEAPRACDAPAVAAAPDLCGWVAALSDEDRRGLRGRTLAQLLLGEPVLVEEVVDRWARVIAVEQPCPSRDPRGYPGWVPAAHLVPANDAVSDGLRWVVDALVTTLSEEPGGRPVIEVQVGTSLTAVGAARDDHVPVWVAGRAGRYWVRRVDLAMAAAGSPVEVMSFAQRFVGVKYVWGGLSPYGIDCSGLIHLVGRRFGSRVPRDAADQAAVCERVDTQDHTPGRLVFFTDGNGQIYHVGVIEKPGWLLHASGSAGRVQSEPLTGELERSLASTGRLL